VIVVDDGSSDRTAEVVSEFVLVNAAVKLLRHDRNLGYGAALRTGFAAAQLDLVAFTDADCQFHLRDLRYMLPLMGQYDVMCGSRINRQDSALRSFCSWGFNSLIKLLLGSPVHDVDCALKVFHRDQLSRLLPESTGYFANAEMLSRARSEGLTVGEIGVSHRPRSAGESKVSLLAVPRTLAALLPFWWTRHQYPGADAVVNRAPAWFFIAMAVLAIVSAAQLFAHLDYPLFEPDEGRYAEIGREMLVNDEWTVPTLHQEPYLDKPPLFYWLLAMSFRCGGVHDWVARLVPAGAAWISILATGLLGRRIVGNRAALVAAFGLTLTPGFVFAGRFLVLDSVLSLLIALAMLTAYEAIRGERVAWGWWLASAACCGLALLTKGPVALLLTLPPLMAHCWLTGQIRMPSRWHWLAYLGLAAALAVPWFLSMLATHPGFAGHFFWDHHVARFFSGLNHPQPFWYYLPVLLAGGLPWTVLLLPWLVYQLSHHPAIVVTRSPAQGFFLLWAGWCLVFFSVSSCKLPPYILPAAPALALLMGVFAESLATQQGMKDLAPRLLRLAPLTGTGLLAVTLVALVWIAWWADLESGPQAFATSVVCGAFVGPLVLRKKGAAPKIRWALCCGMALVFAGKSGHDLAPALAQRRSPLPWRGELAEVIRDPANGVIIQGRECGSIPFYLSHKCILRLNETSPDALYEVLLRHRRTVLFSRLNRASELKRAIPTDINAIYVGSAGRSSIWLLENPVRSAVRTGVAERQ
jgi:dolichol-phosphate mannosyltransferase